MGPAAAQELIGKIQSADGYAIPYAQVEVCGPSQDCREVYSDRGGEFYLEGLEAGHNVLKLPGKAAPQELDAFITDGTNRRTFTVD
ncbi:MAG: hypothetical protein AcusKO_19150 [Acuticoccus sp.]